jgi:hypothetical protein
VSPRAIRVLVVGPSTRCDLTPVAGLVDWRRIIGGNLSSLVLPETLRARGLAAYCNDDGVALELPPNRFAQKLGYWRLLGPVAIFRDQGDGDEHGLSPNEVKFLARYLTAPPSLEALASAERDRTFLENHPAGFSMHAFETLDDLLRALGVPVEEPPT